MSSPTLRPTDPDGLPPGLAVELLEALPTAVVVLDADDVVVLANPAARELGVVVDGRAAAPLHPVVAQARAGARHRDVPLALPAARGRQAGRPQAVSAVRVQAWSLGSGGYVGLVVDDVTEARRVEAVRRDFVANVGHELKTPVGALGLLAEAVAAAADDPAAVRRFADRMAREAARLGHVVHELIELSRLEGADPLPALRRVEVQAVVAEAVDRTALAAQAKNIDVVVVGGEELYVAGDARQLTTAVSNLLDNAVAHSPSDARVVVGLRARGDTVEVSVADEGVGIAATDLDRVFERFYRSDPARSRDTGGSGLGLAIVKHVVANHGGEVSVWSAEGSGSTFVIRLPAYGQDGPSRPGAPAADAG